MSLTSGQLLAERYRLGHRIAVGGMGEVWQAADIRLDRDVAVKVLKPELSGDPEFLHRFRTEARTTASLNHPGIAAVHDYGETAAVVGGPLDTAYLVMELVTGEPLAAVIQQRGRLSADVTLDFLEQAGHALQAAHSRGLVHRDVKPGNILITPTGMVKLTDFGIAKAVDAAPVTHSGMVMGTAHYIAPEQATGADAEPASDVYALGVIGYECLTGQRPFLSDNAVTVAMMHIREQPPPLPADVPFGIRSLLEATLVKDPRQRYRTGGEFAAAAAAIRAGRPLPLPAGRTVAAAASPGQARVNPPTALLPPSASQHQQVQPGPSHNTGAGTYPPPPQRARRNRTLWWVLGIIGAALVIGLLLWLALNAGSSENGRPAVGSSAGRGAGPSPTEPAATGEPTRDQGIPRDTQRPVFPPQQPAITTVPTMPEDGANEDGENERGEVEVDPGDYLGREAHDVVQELSEAGLEPVVFDVNGEEVNSERRRRCDVVDVSPTGTLHEGDSVTVTCVNQPG